MSLRSCLIAATIFSAGLIARADTITTFAAEPFAGTVTIDTTGGDITADSLSFTQSGTLVNLNFVGGGQPDGRVGLLFTDDQANDAYFLLLSSSSLVGYKGSDFIVSDISDKIIASGTLIPIATPSAVPEPSTLLLLGTGALTLAGAVRRRISL